jgi:hypothetical protein
MSTPSEPNRDPLLPDNRYGTDVPYDDVYDENGDLDEGPSVDDILAALVDKVEGNDAPNQ